MAKYATKYLLVFPRRPLGYFSQYGADVYNTSETPVVKFMSVLSAIR
jgi:hypothetical protein